METSFKPVNIPETPQNPSAGSSYSSYQERAGDASNGFFEFLLISITVIMFLISVGMFSWRMLLNSGIEDKRKELSIMQDQITAMKLDDIQKISTKFHTVKYLVENYPFIGNIFNVLEHSVEAGVVYNKFDTHFDSTNGGYSVDVSGIAPGYHSLIQQIDILKSDPVFLKYFVSTELGDFKLDDKGNVNFSFKIKSNINGVTPLIVINDLSNSKLNYNTEIVSTTTQQQSDATSIPVVTGQKKLKTPVVPNSPGI